MMAILSNFFENLLCKFNSLPEAAVVVVKKLELFKRLFEIKLGMTSLDLHLSRKIFLLLIFAIWIYSLPDP